jgi:hypothetical protein
MPGCCLPYNEADEISLFFFSLRFVEDEFGFKDIPFFTPILLYWFDG